MLVRELKKRLSEFDDEAEVFVRRDDGGASKVADAVPEYAAEAPGCYYAGTHSLSEEDGEPVVLLET